jgi:hypothetical protein
MLQSIRKQEKMLFVFLGNTLRNKFFKKIDKKVTINFYF